MTQDRLQVITNMTTRQKVTAVVFVLIVIFLIWQIIGYFRGGSTPPAPTITMNNQTMKPPVQPQQHIPQPAPLPKQPPLSQREMELLKLQQETQAKYIGALNELQMLKVQREIAENTKAIMTAKLDTVTAEKNIVNLLTVPVPPVSAQAYAQGLVNPAAGQPPQGQITPPTEVKYTVISVSQLQSKWNAVLGYQGNLYHVSVGDVMPADGSIVIAIDKTGVTLQKDGVKKKVSLVPII